MGGVVVPSSEEEELKDGFASSRSDEADDRAAAGSPDFDGILGEGGTKGGREGLRGLRCERWVVWDDGEARFIGIGWKKETANTTTPDL
jgi:hypothetical protein